METREWSIVDGRPITAEDSREAAKVAMIGQTVAHRLFGIGGAIGIILGLGGSHALNYVADWRILIAVEACLLALGFAVAVGVGFGFYPASKAARLNPIEALRYE